MKKIFLLMGLLMVLAGCKDQSVYNNYTKENKEPVKEETIKNIVSPNVMVHGSNGVANGYVIDAKNRKKWIVTIASTVSGHPNTIVVTSEGKEIEADVIGMDEENNLAILYVNNSANIKPYTFSDKSITQAPHEISEAQLDQENNLQGLVTVTRQNNRFNEELVGKEEIERVLSNAKKNPITYKERIELDGYFKDFPAMNMESENKFYVSDRFTFSYNPDELLMFIDSFHSALNSYFNTGERETLNSYIGSDNLKEHLATLKQNENLQLASFKTKSINSIDYQYVVELETTIKGQGEDETVTEIVKCILQNNEWKVISFKFQDEK